MLKVLSKEDILKNLDDEQAEACSAPYDNIIVRANAGSGKTRVITHRVAYMIADGIDESRIMLLTFTNKASREMLDRVKVLLGKEEIGVLGGTFHRVANIFLKGYAVQVGYKRNYNILDADDAEKLIGKLRKKYIKDHDLDAKEVCSASVMYAKISGAINKNRALVDEMAGLNETSIKAGEYIRETYAEEKLRLNVMDFDDLLLNFRKLLMNEKTRERIARQYKYLLVDEFQDINWIQAEIIQLLNKDNDHLFAVGDANQAIYGWRGSDITYIESFDGMFRGVQEYYITRNYRSDAEILKYAESSINNNYIHSPNRVKITPVLPAAQKPIVSVYRSDYDQDRGIADKIVALRRSGVRYNDMAILVRTNYLANFLERCLRERGVPYRLLAGVSFFERRHVKDLLCFLRLANNPGDEVAFTRICDLFEGVGPKTAENALETFRASGYSLDINVGQIKGTKAARDSFAKLFELLKEVKEAPSIRAMIETAMDGFYDNYMQMNFEDYDERIGDIQYLDYISDSFGSLDDFLTDMALDGSIEEAQSEEQESDAVVVTTIHKAKGLEWDVVFLPYLADQCLPHHHCDELEERRLFYVGVTRARKRLEISFAYTIRTTLCYPSPFLHEVHCDLFEIVDEM